MKLNHEMLSGDKRRKSGKAAKETLTFFTPVCTDPKVFLLQVLLHDVKAKRLSDFQCKKQAFTQCEQ